MLSRGYTTSCATQGSKCKLPSALPQRSHMGPIGGAPPMGPMGPQGPQEGTGSLPGGSPGQGEHGEVVPDVFGKSHFSTPKTTKGW